MLTKAALEGMAAAGAAAREATYIQACKNSVPKEGGHAPLPPLEKSGARRLYAITTIARNQQFGGTRCVAVCDSFERAQEIVVSNEGDIYEASYRLVVVETLRCNYLYSTGPEQYWYRWYPEQNGYVAIETPKEYENIIGWGIG